MIIPLDDQYRIRGTEHCWQLEKRRIRNDKHEWEAYKYFQSFGEAMGAACRREIRLHPAVALADAIEAVDRIVSKYERIFDEALDVVESRRAA